jgi:hypothetical protein
MTDFTVLKDSFRKFADLIFSEEDIPIEIKNKDKAHFLGLDIENLLRRSMNNKDHLFHIDVRKNDNKINIKFLFKSNNRLELKVSLRESADGKYFLDMVIGGKAVRMKSRIKHIDDDRFELYFKQISRVISSIFRNYDLNEEGFSFANRKEIIKLLDSTNKLLIN